MKIQLNSSTLDQIKADVVVLPIFEEQSSPESVLNIEVAKRFLKDNPKFGKLYETQLLYDENQKYLCITFIFYKVSARVNFTKDLLIIWRED